MRFHLLDPLGEDVLQLGDLTLLDASPFEHFNYVLERFIKMTFVRKVSTMEEAVNAMNIFPLQK